MKTTSEAAFESVIEAHLLSLGYKAQLNDRLSAQISAAVTGKIAIPEPSA